MTEIKKKKEQLVEEAAPWDQSEQQEAVEPAPWDEPGETAPWTQPKKKKRSKEELLEELRSYFPLISKPEETVRAVTGSVKKGVIPFVGQWLDEIGGLSKEEEEAIKKHPAFSTAVEIGSSLLSPLPGSFVSKFPKLIKFGQKLGLTPDTIARIFNVVEAGVSGAGAAEEGERTGAGLTSAAITGTLSKLGKRAQKGTVKAGEKVEEEQIIKRLKQQKKIDEEVIKDKLIKEAQKPENILELNELQILTKPAVKNKLDKYKLSPDNIKKVAERYNLHQNPTEIKSVIKILEDKVDDQYENMGKYIKPDIAGYLRGFRDEVNKRMLKTSGSEGQKLANKQQARVESLKNQIKEYDRPVIQLRQQVDELKSELNKLQEVEKRITRPEYLDAQIKEAKKALSKVDPKDELGMAIANKRLQNLEENRAISPENLETYQRISDTLADKQALLVKAENAAKNNLFNLTNRLEQAEDALYKKGIKPDYKKVYEDVNERLAEFIDDAAARDSTNLMDLVHVKNKLYEVAKENKQYKGIAAAFNEGLQELAKAAPRELVEQWQKAKTNWSAGKVINDTLLKTIAKNLDKVGKMKPTDKKVLEQLIKEAEEAEKMARLGISGALYHALTFNWAPVAKSLAIGHAFSDPIKKSAGRIAKEFDDTDLSSRISRAIGQQQSKAFFDNKE